MRTSSFRSAGVVRPVALVLTASLIGPTLLVGCGGQPQTNQPAMAPAGQSMGRPAMQQPAMRQSGGMSTRKKVVLLAGAAALYYLYKKRQNAQQQQGPQGKYFLSKNGRVYYRDLKTGAFQYVSPPRQPISVPAEEAQEYSGYQGYNNTQQGRGFGGYGDGANNYPDAVPAQF